MALVRGPDPPRQVDWEKLGKPAALNSFFRRALAKDVHERFLSAAEIIDAMSALTADKETASGTVIFVQPAPEKVTPVDPEKLKMIREEERALELTPTISDVLQGVVLTSEEGFVLSRIDGTSRPKDVLAVSPLDEESTTRVLLGMVEKDLVRFREAETTKVHEKRKPSRGAHGEEKRQDVLRQRQALGRDTPLYGEDTGAFRRE